MKNMASVDRRLKRMENIQQEENNRDTVIITYTDGSTKTVVETVAIIAEEIEDYSTWYSIVYNDYVTDKVLISSVKNLRTGETWNFEESIREPYSEEEIDEIIEEVEKNAKKHRFAIR